MGIRRFIYAVPCAALLMAMPVRASADASPKDLAHAAELKKQGDEHVHASRFREALQAYEESYAVVPDPAILYNRGRAYQQMGDLPAALDALERFQKEAPANLKARVPNLGKTIDEIAAQVATLVINCPLPGATVTVRGRTVGTTPLAAPIRTSVGDTSIEVTAPGYDTFKRDVTLGGGSTTTIDAELVKVHDEPKKVAPSQPTEPPPEAAPSTGRGWKTFAIVSGSVGIASVGAGMIFFGLALSDKGNADTHCPGKVCDGQGRQSLDEAQTFATVSTVLVVVGAVALAGAATGFLVSPRSAPVEARLVIGPGFGGVRGAW